MVDFDRVKLSDLWYTVGYIAADGHLSIDGRHINITSKDAQHLYLIRNALYLHSKIGMKYRSDEKIKKYSHLQFGDIKFYNFLLDLGFVQQKSLHLGSIRVESLFFNDFLRGVIDGDGHITTWVHRTNFHKQWCLGITSASNVFIVWLYEEILKRFNVKGKLYAGTRKDRINTIYRLKFGKIAAKKILSEIYYPDCLSLERKYLKARLCLQDNNKMIN